MPDHIRNQIRDRAAVAVTSLTTTGSNVFQTPIVTPEEQTFPALAVYVDSEVSSENATMGNILRECILHIDGYVEVKNYSNVNIAGAESLPTADSFRQYLEKNTFDIIQFDIATSGFTEGKKIASLSSFYQKPLAIHSWGTIISILSGIHMALSASNCVYTEFGFMDHPFNGYLSNEKYQVHDGFFNAKQLGSGLGVRFDDQMEKLFPYNPSKINSMISFEETFNAL